MHNTRLLASRANEEEVAPRSGKGMGCAAWMPHQGNIAESRDAIPRRQDVAGPHALSPYRGAMLGLMSARLRMHIESSRFTGASILQYTQGYPSKLAYDSEELISNLYAAKNAGALSEASWQRYFSTHGAELIKKYGIREYNHMKHGR